ncbi:MAG: phosphonate ABC transporter, permease protein PhnE [Actinomycetota bacterium]
MTAKASPVEQTAVQRLPNPTREWWQPVSWAAVILLALWSLWGLDARWERLLDAPADLWNLGRLLFTDMAFDRTGDLLVDMWESIAIAWLGTLIAGLVAVPLSFLAAENLAGRAVALAVRQVLNILRAVPEVILAIAFIPLLGLTPMAGVMAIGIGSIGTLGKLFAEVIESISPHPVEAVDAVGGSRLQRLRWGVVPQVLPEIASFLLYRFEINVRASAVLGVIGAGGIGGTIAQTLQFKQFEVAGLGLVIVVVATIIVDLISGTIRRRIVRGPTG